MTHPYKFLLVDDFFLLCKLLTCKSDSAVRAESHSRNLAANQSQQCTGQVQRVAVTVH
jgi:hypothetical protein